MDGGADAVVALKCSPVLGKLKSRNVSDITLDQVPDSELEAFHLLLREIGKINYGPFVQVGERGKSGLQTLFPNSRNLPRNRVDPLLGEIGFVSLLLREVSPMRNFDLDRRGILHPVVERPEWLFVLASALHEGAKEFAERRLILVFDHAYSRRPAQKLGGDLHILKAIGCR